MEILIRKERPEDRQQVYDLVRSAFENVEESDHTEHLLVERLRMSDAFIPELSLVAVIRDGNNSSAEMTVGHILLTKIEIVASDGRSWPSLAVAPLSVLPGFQRMGIGGMLIREAHRRAASLGHSSAMLLGHKDYYPRFGYRKASGFGIRFPFDAPDECCLAIEFHPGSLSHIHGLIRYPAAFNL